MYDDSDSSCAEEHEMDDNTQYMSDSLEENNIYELYICLSDTTNGKRYLVEGNTIFIYQRMD